MPGNRDQYKSSYGAFSARERELARSRERRDAEEAASNGDDPAAERSPAGNGEPRTSDERGNPMDLADPVRDAWLAERRRRAEAAGWTDLDVDAGGSAGGLRLVGVPPGGSARTDVPDRPDLLEADAR